MKYTVEMSPPVMANLVQEARRRLVFLTDYKHQAVRSYGRGSRQAIQASAILSQLEQAIDALAAAYVATPIPASHGTYDNPSLQVGDEMPLVYGRPRVKRSNERRRAKQL